MAAEIKRLRFIHFTTFVALVIIPTGFVVAIIGDVLSWWDIVHRPLLPLFWLTSSFALCLLNSATESPPPTNETG